MKFYIATRFSNELLKNKAIAIKNELEKLGHNMTFNWMSYPSLKPYDQNLVEASKIAKLDLEGVIDADFLILLPDSNGTGLYVEFGVAIAQCLMTKSPKIYLLSDSRKMLLFNYHPAVIWKKTLEEIISDL